MLCALLSAFQPELEALEKKGRLHALRVDKCPITGRSTSLGTRNTDDFACHMLGAGVCELGRWRPAVVNCPLDLAWSGPSGGSE